MRDSILTATARRRHATTRRSTVPTRELALERDDARIVRAVPITPPAAVEPRHLRALRTARASVVRELERAKLDRTHYAERLLFDFDEMVAMVARCVA